MNTYIISLGSNINPQENFIKAIQIIKDKYKLISQSEFLVTTPEGYLEQEDFLNGCIKIESAQTSEKLKSELLSIEEQLLRVRTENKNGPRTIDLDITAINGEIVDRDYDKYWFVKQSVDQIIND